MTDDPHTEIARRIGTARFCCRTVNGDLRHQPCPHCRSEVFQGCFYLAEAVLTPEVEISTEEGTPIR